MAESSKTPSPNLGDFEMVDEFDVDPEISTDHAVLGDEGASEQNTLSIVSAAPNHLLLVALLEHLCNLYIKDSNKSNQLFKVLCQRLIQMNILSPLGGYDELGPLRGQYRDRFSRLVQAAISVINQPDIGISLKKDIQQNAHMFLQPRLPTMSPGMSLSQVMGLNTSRYHEEFLELCPLGTGAYGSVFKALHKLDGREYAVKKISFSETDPEVWLKVLREVKYLARIDHHSVVRYHGAWMEYVSTYFSDEGTNTMFSAANAPNGLPAITLNEDSSDSLSFSGVAPVPNREDSDNSLSVVFEEPNHLHPNQRFLQWGQGDVCPDVSQESSIVFESRERSQPWHNRERNEENIFTSKAVVVLFIQMELCQQTLKEWLSQRNSMLIKNSNVYSVVTEDDNLKILRQILKAVDHIHQHNIIHRDLKPKNIFLSSSTKTDIDVKVGDFGLARHTTHDEVPMTPQPGRTEGTSMDSKFYTSGVGTTIYAAPEQLQGSVYDSKSDMYSLGLVVFELYQPFKTEMERFHILTQLRKGSIIPEFITRWPKVADVVKSLLHEDPVCRPSATELLQSELFLSKDQIIEKLKAEKQTVIAEALSLSDKLKVKEMDMLKLIREHGQQLQEKDREIETLRNLLLRVTMAEHPFFKDSPV